MKVVRRIVGILLGVALVVVLVGAVLLFTGRSQYRVYVVESNSMGAAMPAGSIIVVDTDSDIQVGDIITFQVGLNEITTHRLIAVNPDGTIVTKGDAVEQVDPFVATTDDIIGEVVAIFPRLGKVVAFLSTPAGFASIVLLVIGGGVLISVLTGKDHKGEPGKEDHADSAPG